MCLLHTVAFISVIVSLTATTVSLGCFAFLLSLVIDTNLDIISQLSNYEAITCLVGISTCLTGFVSICVLYSRYILVHKMVDERVEARKNILLGYSD